MANNRNEISEYGKTFKDDSLKLIIEIGESEYANDGKMVVFSDINQEHGNVVHLRNFPRDCTFVEVNCDDCVHYGEFVFIDCGIVCSIWEDKKCPALIEFENYEGAHKMILYGRERNINLKRHEIYIQTSQHQTLKTRTTDCRELDEIQRRMLITEPCTVLHLVVNDVVYPITMKIVYSLFSLNGRVRRILKYFKEGRFHALIQMNSKEEAYFTKLTLDNQNIYTGSNKMKIMFHRNEELDINAKDLETARDFDVYPLEFDKTSQESLSPKKYSNYGDMQIYQPHNDEIIPAPFHKVNRSDNLSNQFNDDNDRVQGSYDRYGSNKYSYDDILPNRNKDESHPYYNINPYPTDFRSNERTPPRSTSKISRFDRDDYDHRHDSAMTSNIYSYPDFSEAPPNMSNPVYNPDSSYRNHYDGNNQSYSHIKSYDYSDESPSNRSPPHIRPNYRNEPEKRLSKSHIYLYENRESDRHSYNDRDSSHCIILVSNLPENIITDDLEKFYGTFGNIKIVKIMYSKRDTALIQFFTHEMAQQALHHTQNVPYRQKRLKITMSYHTSISHPRPFEKNPDLYTDYTECNHHRFKNPGSKNFNNIYPPSRVLHISNIPRNFNQDTVIALFADYGFTCHDYHAFLNDHTMAHVTLDSISDSIDALMKFHNFQTPSGYKLKVSFSRPKNSFN